MGVSSSLPVLLRPLIQFLSSVMGLTLSINLTSLNVMFNIMTFILELCNAL